MTIKKAVKRVLSELDHFESAVVALRNGGRRYFYSGDSEEEVAATLRNERVDSVWGVNL